MDTKHCVFEWQQHERFARASGDLNPIHVDPIAARRTHAGAPIVHGIHTLMWMLECLAQEGFFSARAKNVKAQFLRPIYVGELVVLEIIRATTSAVKARALIGDDEVVVVNLGFDELKRGTPANVPERGSRIEPLDAPMDRNLNEMDGLAGRLAFAPGIADVANQFPTAARAIGAHRLHSLACTSCLVGMVVPGLHSLFSGLEVELVEDADAPHDELCFAVTSISQRFRSVRIAVVGPGLRGSLDTVSRMPPVKQPGLNQLLNVVSPREFRGATALIVGGSRGLGELTSKLVAAGGGDVVVTYASGQREAQSLVKEIEAIGSKSMAIPYDVRRSAADQLAHLPVGPTHLYFFATPLIARRKSAAFDVHRFVEFNSFYVNAFFDIVRTCNRLRPQGLRVFYPSSSYVDKRPPMMTEYAMSKAAAEILCDDLPKLLSGVKILVRRLPRLPTDQTNSTIAIEMANPVEVMLPIVREMHSES